MSGADTGRTRIPDLDDWLAERALTVAHRRESTASPDQLWAAARAVRVSDAALLGRLVRWRIPGLAPDVSFDALFREPPFTELATGERWLISGMVGRIWTLRRDYPQLESSDEFRRWSQSGTARVVFGLWVEEVPGGGAAITAEARVQGLGSQGRLGVAAVRPLVRAFQHLVGSEGISAAVRRAEQG